MELRLGDLYDLIARIVDDRLRHWRETAAAPEDATPIGEVSTEKRTTPAPSAPTKENLPSQQLQELVNLQRQLLLSFQHYQQRSEALLEELKGLVMQALERLDREEHDPAPPKAVEPPDGVKDGFGNDVPAATSLTPTVEPAVFVPVTAAAVPSPRPSWSDLLPSYLQRRYSIQVNYLRERALPAPLGEAGVKVLVGEGTQNGQGVTLAAFAKEQVAAADVGVFYNAIVKPLRASVSEPLIGIVIGDRFDPKATRVAYAHELIVVKADDLLPGSP